MRIADNISFGVELEGLIPYWPDKPLAENGATYIKNALQAAGLHAVANDKTDSSPSPSRWVCKRDPSIYATDEDKTKYNTEHFIKFEISSPVLAGEEGLTQVGTMLKAVISLGAFANKSCGWHVHASPVDRPYTKAELRNFVNAASPKEHEKEYLALIGNNRIYHSACYSYLSSRTNSQDIDRLSTEDLIGNRKECKITLMRAVPLGFWGRVLPFRGNPLRNPFMKTIEFRGKEAEGFEKNGGAEHLDYTATVVNFTGMAIKNPAASFSSAARQSCQGGLGEVVPTRTTRLAANLARYAA